MRYLLLAFLLSGCSTTAPMPRYNTEENTVYLCFIASCDIEVVSHSAGGVEQEESNTPKVSIMP